MVDRGPCGKAVETLSQDPSPRRRAAAASVPAPDLQGKSRLDHDPTSRADSLLAGGHRFEPSAATCEPPASAPGGLEPSFRIGRLREASRAQVRIIEAV